MIQTEEKKFDKDWDSYSNKIETRKEAPEWAVLREARKSHWDEFFPIVEGEKILDAGCGNGEYALWAIQDGAKVWAFDYSEMMVSHTRNRLNTNGATAEKLTVDSVTKIPYPDKSFDKVFCLAVLDHLSESDRTSAMQEISRVTKDGGKIYIDVPNRYAYHWRAAFEIMRLLKRYPAGKIHFFTPAEIASLVRRHGFEPTKTLGLTIGPPISGIYTTDLRRFTILPEFLIRALDRIYIYIEKALRRNSLFKRFCWHYFMEAEKTGR